MFNANITKFIMPIFAMFILLLIVAGLAGSFNDKVAPELRKLPVEEAINSYEVTTRIVPSQEPVAASITAKQATIISSRILARVNNIYVRAGEKVKKGQLLITLENQDLLAQVKQATETVNASYARLNEARKNLERAIELERQGLISTIQRDKSQTEHDTLAADLLAAEQIKMQAQTALSYSELRSPIEGIVVDRFAEPGDTAQPATKLMSLYNPLSLRVEAQVREQLALTLSHGQEVMVEIPSLHQQVHAEIEEIVPAANTGSRSFLVKANIAFSSQLLPGMYARMNIATNPKNILFIPKKYVHSFGQLSMVWVMENDTKQRRLIRVGAENNQDEIEVVSGLSEGEIIVF